MSLGPQWRVVWQMRPLANNPQRVLIVEAPTAEDAKAVAEDWIEQGTGLTGFSIQHVHEYTPLDPSRGRVVSQK